MPKVSVIVPMYNVEKYVSKCLDSLQKQTLKDIEIICVDDLSTDSTVNIVANLSKQDNRIKLIKNEINVGAAITRNNGLEIATGEYIYFIDSDDWIDDDYLEKMVKTIEKVKTDIVLNLSIVSEYPDKSIPYVHPTMSSIPLEGCIYTKDKIIIDAPCHIWARLYKREFLEKYNLRFLDVKTCNDFVFHYLTNIRTAQSYVFYGATYHYISRDDSITGLAKQKKNQDLCVMQAYSVIFDYLTKHNLLEDNLNIKLFCVWPHYRVDTLEKFEMYRNFFIKIYPYFEKTRFIYNELELFFADIMLNSNSFEDYQNKYNSSITMSFIKRKKNG